MKFNEQWSSIFLGDSGESQKHHGLGTPPLTLGGLSVVRKGGLPKVRTESADIIRVVFPNGLLVTTIVHGDVAVDFRGS